MVLRRDGSGLLRVICWMLLVGMVAVAACRPQPDRTPVKYPPGWPLPQVTVPDGSRRAIIETLPVDRDDPLNHGYTIDGTMIGGNRNYVVGFFYDGKWDDAVEHIEKCLEGTSYRVLENSNTKTTSVMEFDIRSRQINVQLYRQKIGSQYHYHLRAIVY